MDASDFMDLVLGIPLLLALVVGYLFGPFVVPGTELRVLFVGLVASVPWALSAGVVEGTRGRMAGAPFSAAGYGVFAWGMASGNLVLARWVGIGCILLAIVIRFVAGR